MSTWMFLIIVFPLFCQRAHSDEELRRLPKFTVNYRCLVDEIDHIYRILGSSTIMNKTESMTRCIIQIRHKYYLNYFSLSMDRPMIEPGMIISKRIEGRSRIMSIVTAFDVLVSQLDLYRRKWNRLPVKES